jgi:hypothetical protein
MSKILATTVTPGSICLIMSDGDTQVITGDSHRNYDAIRAAIKARDPEGAIRLIDIAKELTEKYAPASERVQIEHGVLTLDGRHVGGVIADRILTMFDEGFDIEPMCKFVENLYDNPSYKAVNELYGFLEATDLPITEDGHFLAYKMVRADFKSHYDGKTDNSVGSTPKMPRNMVDENADQTCSKGLHFCSQSYLNHYASNGIVVIVKVNPRDVVSIPTDYDNSKGRACEYLVTGVFDVKPTKEHSFGTTVADETMEKTGFAKIDEQLKGGLPFSELNVFAATGAEGVGKGTFRDVATGRQSTVSGGIEVMTDGRLLDGDVIFKREACDELDMTMEELLYFIERDSIDVVENSNGHDLVVWYDYYRELEVNDIS